MQSPQILAFAVGYPGTQDNRRTMSDSISHIATQTVRSQTFTIHIIKFSVYASLVTDTSLSCPYFCKMYVPVGLYQRARRTVVKYEDS